MDQPDIDQLVSEDFIDVNGTLMDQVMDIFHAGGSFTVNGVLQNVLIATNTIDIEECLKNLESQGLIEVTGENPLRWQLASYSHISQSSANNLSGRHATENQSDNPSGYHDPNLSPSHFDNSTKTVYQEDSSSHHPRSPGSMHPQQPDQKHGTNQQKACPPPPSAALFQSLMAQCKSPSAPVPSQPIRGRGINQSHAPSNFYARFPTFVSSRISAPLSSYQSRLPSNPTQIYPRNRFPGPPSESSTNSYRPPGNFQMLPSAPNKPLSSNTTHDKEKSLNKNINKEDMGVHGEPAERPSNQSNYKTSPGSSQFPKPPSAEMFRTLQNRGPQKTTPTSIGSGPSSGAKNLTTLESQVLEFMKETRKPCDTLQLAHACGKRTKKDVNPTLYHLQSMGLILKMHDKPPTWKLRSDNMEIINSLGSKLSNPISDATASSKLSNPFGKRSFSVDDRPLQKMAHISMDDQPHFNRGFSQWNTALGLDNPNQTRFSQDNNTLGFGNSYQGFPQSTVTSGLGHSSQPNFIGGFPQSNVSSGSVNSENQTQALSKIVHSAINQNPVSALNEYAQKNRLELTFETMNERKGFNKPPYTVAVVLGGKMYPSATASNVKDAKREACDAALRCLLGQNMGRNTELNMSQPTAEMLRGARTHFDLVAALSQHAFVQLAATIEENIAGRKVVACFVMKRGPNDTGHVVSLGSGNRCVTGQRLSMEGKVVNDSHAEIVARRSLHRFLYAQIKSFYNGEDSIFEKSNNSSYLTLKNGISFHLYISTAPCGDGALFTPKLDDVLTQPPSEDGSHAPEFSSKTQGILRTKIEDGEGTIPIDPNDGPQTWDGLLRGQRLRTMSCSDKICRWNAVGLQGALLSHFIEPIYLSSLTLGYLYDHGHLSRAVCCRLQHKSDLGAELESPFKLNHPILGRVTAYEASRHTEKTNNLSLNWTFGDTGAEVIDGRTGACLSRTRNSPTPARICKASLYGQFRELCLQTKREDLLNVDTYREAKDSAKQFQNAKRMMYECFKRSKYGSWVSKPAEQEMF